MVGDPVPQFPQNLQVQVNAVAKVRDRNAPIQIGEHLVQERNPQPEVMALGHQVLPVDKLQFGNDLARSSETSPVVQIDKGEKDRRNPVPRTMSPYGEEGSGSGIANHLQAQRFWHPRKVFAIVRDQGQPMGKGAGCDPGVVKLGLWAQR